MTLAQLLAGRGNRLGQLATLFEKLRPVAGVYRNGSETEFQQRAEALALDVCELFTPEACSELGELFKTLSNGATDASLDHRLPSHLEGLAYWLNQAAWNQYLHQGAKEGNPKQAPTAPESEKP